MTRERIIHGLYRGDSRAIKEAIKALEQKPCEDAISRADAIRVASGYCHPANIAKELAKLPPVTPKTECSCDQIKWERDMAIAQLNELGYGLGEKPRTAHWIEHQESISTAFKHLRECSYCKCYFDWMMPRNSYCPNCGAKMIDPQENEG